MTLYGRSQSVEYLEMAMAMYRLIKMNHSYKITQVFLHAEEEYVGFKVEKQEPHP